ncbi:hybrid sensor histidine kinase/response regulator [Arenibacterium halophilum]|uniref:histidine kinase n=1 Tax=Arenibacterium halophilum TaxID=2583821 RepID=A0ABY2XG74_9RHOB|nr:ATP-binding protein [Arenibacterium halophilum]TMV15663.1 response regulator [Arenibacterium halophilum]
MTHGYSDAERRGSDASFDDSPDARMVRYAQGRVRHFTSRQALTISGSVMIAAIVSPLAGLATAAVALLGESIDCLFLRGVARRLDAGVPIAREIRLSALTAALQAVTIAACVIVAYAGFAGQVPLFAVAFLAAAAVNGGLVLPYVPAAAMARLGVYGITAAGLLGWQASVLPVPDAEFFMNAVGILIMAYLVFAFVDYVMKGARRNRAIMAALRDQRRALQRANAELSEREREARQLSLVARHANDSVILMDPDGRIRWVNDAFERVTGYAREQATGQMVGDLLNHDGSDRSAIAAIQGAHTAGQPLRTEICNKTRDGQLVWIETNQVPVFDADGRLEMFIAIERDMTEARKAAADLDEAKQKAEIAARSKADFLADMSHEIRTPMNGIIGMADLLCETPLSSEQKTYAQAIRASGKSLLAVVNDVLDLSRLDARKLRLDPVAFDLGELLRETAVLFRSQTGPKGLTLGLDLPKDASLNIVGDDGRLRQILVNLVGNAVKFTPEGRVDLSVRPRRVGSRPGVSISVADTGIGIAADRLDAIFDRFGQAESATPLRFEGAGLGLTISRMLAQAMGGDISAVSTPGKGSTFTLRLPLNMPGRRQEDRPPDTDLADTIRRLDGRRILVAEDNAVNRMLIEKFLRDVPVHLDFAEDGREAVRIACETRPDLVLMDMSMPLLSGTEAAREIRRTPGRQPAIVALTANAFDSDRDECFDAGMDGFLTKPVRRKDLIVTMATHCAPRPVVL